jgi:hypothetical protein
MTDDASPRTCGWLDRWVVLRNRERGPPFSGELGLITQISTNDVLFVLNQKIKKEHQGPSSRT